MRRGRYARWVGPDAVRALALDRPPHPVPRLVGRCTSGRAAEYNQSSWRMARRGRGGFVTLPSSGSSRFRTGRASSSPSAALDLLTIFLRQRGSPESKPVAAPTSRPAAVETPTRPGTASRRAPDGVADHVPRAAGLPYGSAPSRAATRESAPTDRGRDVRARVGGRRSTSARYGVGRPPRCCCGGRRTHRRAPPGWCSPAGAGGGHGRCCGRSGLKDPRRSSKSPLSEVLSRPSATNRIDRAPMWNGRHVILLVIPPGTTRPVRSALAGRPT